MSQSPHHDGVGVLRELADPRCRRLLTPRLVPPLYVGLVLAWAYALVWLVVVCFERAAWLGWLHALVIAPAGLAIGAMFARALLEFGLAVLEIRDHADALGELPRRVSTWPAMRRIVALGEARVWTSRRSQTDD